MKTIRKGVFETNSSSMHSIAVYREDKKRKGIEKSKYGLVNGYVRLHAEDLEFERWPYQRLATVIGKARYVIASYLGGWYGRLVDDKEAKHFLKNELYPIIRKCIPEFKGFKFDIEREEILRDPYNPEKAYRECSKNVCYVGYDESPISGYALKKEDGSISPLIIDKDNFFRVVNYGGIDHQSFGLLKGFLKKKGITLEEFITNSAYVVIIDGDEYGTFEKNVEKGIIRIENISEIYSANPWFCGDYKDIVKIETVS